jgi:acyl-CoA reductase-like NAD-dependent aldehyde dehydrogenase
VGGIFFQLTVLTYRRTDLSSLREETFRPVAPLYRFKTDA